MDKATPSHTGSSFGQSPSIEATLSPRLSSAQWQNRMPIVESLVVVGAAHTGYSDLQLSLTCEPALIRPRVWSLDALPAQSRLTIADRELSLSPEWLRKLTEKLRLVVTLTLTSSTGVVAEQFLEIEALPHNHWPGCAHAPALVAAFVQPNDQATLRLAQRTAELLQASGHPGELSGYRQGPTQVWHMLEAAWTTVSELELAYAVPPPSFELQGQKVRSVRQVVENRLATCLDTILLFAGLLEAFGLQPVTLFIKEHALVALWLKPTQFDQPVTRDLATVRNRLSIRELLAFETTLVTGRPPATFLEATQRAAATLSHLTDETFLAAIDVAQARKQGILPLVDDVAEAPAAAAPSEATDRTGPRPASQAPSWLPAEVSATGPAPMGVAATKASPRDVCLAKWKNDLLDLTLNNALLNVKDNKSCIHLVSSDPGQLEDALVQGKKFRLQAMPDLAAQAGSGARKDPEEVLLQELALADKAIAQGTTLYCRLDEEDLDARLTTLYRKCRTLEQEGDSNVLFLAIGSLVWRYDTEQKNHAAPLLLVPVVLSPKNPSKPFVLQIHEDDPRFNPTLVELLRAKFNLKLPLDVENLPRDDNGLDVAAILRAVGKAVRDQPGWEVKFDVRLSVFSFTRFLLWRDLEERAALLERSPIVDHLLNRPLEPFLEGAGFPSASSLDTALKPEDVLCPLPADSSQMVAVQAAIAGKSFIIIGPPGTGKSQTIANIIAQCLAEKKRVLFVSAKAEALNVVYRRLQEVGLGDFCLSMHSHKDAKADVIVQLRKAWAQSPVPNSDAWQRQAARATATRRQLNAYVADLHAEGRNGLTPYRAMAQTLEHTDVPRVALRWDHPDVHDTAAREALRDLAERLGHAALECLELLPTPLTAVTQKAYSRAWQERLVAAAQQVLGDASALAAAHAPLAALGPQLPAELTLHAAVACQPLWRQVAETRTVWRVEQSEQLYQASEALTAAVALLEQHRAAQLALTPACGEADCQQLEQGRPAVVAYRQQLGLLQGSYQIGA